MAGFSQTANQVSTLLLNTFLLTNQLKKPSPFRDGFFYDTYSCNLAFGTRMADKGHSDSPDMGSLCVNPGYDVGRAYGTEFGVEIKNLQQGLMQVLFGVVK